ncbi:hypothetical protein ACFQGE_00390 [Halomicroarcula sp. GCM10025817]|uniref:hypothetical protein n=1 Tax=Haloarcula TaxID=2237 RepID=UPI0023E75CBC|nr:hypothetical protein [Halomicroarcula sp. SYNS111]
METPPLEPGLTFVAQPDGRGGVAALARHADATETLWVDTRGAASTYALTADADRSVLRGLRVARAFTAHQHHALVRRAVDAATARTDLVVAPNLAALYEAADGPDTELDRLYAATCSLLAALGESTGVPVLAGAPDATDAHRETLREAAAREVTCRPTDFGYAVDAPGFTQSGYWGGGWWQTTIPYWVAVCGAVGTSAPATADPVAVAVE